MNFKHFQLFLVLFGTFSLGNLFQTLIMSMRVTTLARGNFCVLFRWRKVTSTRRVTRCCAAGNPPLEIEPLVSELSRDHVNRPLVSVHPFKVLQLSLALGKWIVKIKA